ncbi:OmpA family protein [Roseomonas hellenica]|uniref:OmpA family protein n=2 Tax=Plastoroseomonas hellenica TaxID=2687306 RepID=A0ABS5F871_9PROT|nr:OmpA family protein [Plastoroseomonas hellenica]
MSGGRRVSRTARRAILMVPALALLAACQGRGLTAEQIALLREEGFERIGDDWSLGLSERILFASTRAELTPGARQTVERLGRALRGVGIYRMRVEGHTDAYGDAAYNDQLSQRRAQVVADILIGVGFREQDIVAHGLGSRAPLPGVRSNENRRVAIIVSNDG